MVGNNKEIKLHKGDAKLGITKIEDRGTHVIVHMDKKAAAQNPEAFKQRLDQLNKEIEGEFSCRDPNATRDGEFAKKHGADEYFDMYSSPDAVAEKVAKLQIGGGTMRTKYANYVVLDPEHSLTKFFNAHAKAKNLENSPGAQLERTLSPEQQKAFLNYIKLHEQGHATTRGPEEFITQVYQNDEGKDVKYLMVDAKNMGLEEGGADFYAAAMSLKQNPQSRAMLEMVSDAEVLRFLRNDVKADDGITGHYNFGSYFAMSIVLEMSPDELKKMSEEDIVKMASQFDALSDREEYAEVSVKDDVYREMEAMKKETGRNPTLKEAVDSLYSKNIYAENGTLKGDDNAIKFLTLERMKEALDRLDKKGIELPRENFTPPSMLAEAAPSQPKAAAPGA
ncbi:MAG: hypothetical protein DYH13_01485 [Alphaproteobacteria bacterium PRO2]|nr:hypothetical protein [Alphaproteobacteria bacterium PRO2]